MSDKKRLGNVMDHFRNLKEAEEAWTWQNQKHKKREAADVCVFLLSVTLTHLPATRSQTERACSTRSDGLWSSQSRASGWCSYASTFASGSSGSPPMLTSQWASLQQGLLGTATHPMTPLDRAAHLKRKDRGIYIGQAGTTAQSQSF